MDAKNQSPRQYFVIFRACDTVYAVNQAPRPFGLDKRTLTKVCFLSLYEALQAVEHQIHILADNISAELRQFFAGFPVSIQEGKWGNDESIRQSIGLAMTRADEDWVYLCEDDYLHQPQTLVYWDDFLDHRDEILSYIPRPPYMYLLLRRLKTMPLMFHPPDYPDRYQPKKRTLSFVFVSQHCHWRQIPNTTFTFMAQAGYLKRHRRHLEKSANGARDGYLSRKLCARLSFRRKALCLSPLPGLATHMHETVMTPLVDWRQLCERYLQQLHEIEKRGTTAA